MHCHFADMERKRPETKNRRSENHQNVNFSSRTENQQNANFSSRTRPENVTPSSSYRPEFYDIDEERGPSYQPQQQRSSFDEFERSANEYHSTAPSYNRRSYFPSNFSNRVSGTSIYRPTNEEIVNSNQSHHLQGPLEENRQYVHDIQNDIEENSRQIEKLMRARKHKLDTLRNLDPQSARDFERFNRGIYFCYLLD